VSREEKNAQRSEVVNDQASENGNLAIDVRGMTKSFNGRTVVDHIDLRVRAGEICGFLGPNGSGKTTFIRMLCGLLRPDAGSGTCLGLDVISDSETIKRQVGYMTQRFSFYEDMSIFENLDFVARMYGLPNRREAVRESIDRLGLAARRDQLAGQLSGGWKQRLALAACLIHSPKLLLLDEPTAGVDPKARRDFWEQIHELSGQGLTFLIATHYMDEVERCHRLAYISYGNLLIQGTIPEVISKANLTTWSVEGPRLHELAVRLRGLSGVDQAVAFGNRLHVSGGDAAALERAITPFFDAPYEWRLIESGMEDVFIHLMESSKDNYPS
jgi:ABC-2 type transport system ATP-binding protein